MINQTTAVYQEDSVRLRFHIPRCYVKVCWDTYVRASVQLRGTRSGTVPVVQFVASLCHQCTTTFPQIPCEFGARGCYDCGNGLCEPLGETWDENKNGQLGNDNLGVQSSTPVRVVNLGAVNELMGGKKHLFAWTDDGGIWGWGENDHGQIGDGTLAHQPAPVLVR